MSLWARKTFVSVRVLGTAGHYPSFPIRSQFHLYQPTESLVWTAVVQRPLPDDWGLGESTQLTPEEVRLQAAISLCESDPWNNGIPIVTLWGGTVELEPDRIGFDLRNPDTFEAVRAAAVGIGAPPRSHRNGNDILYAMSDVGDHE